MGAQQQGARCGICEGLAVGGGCRAVVGMAVQRRSRGVRRLRGARCAGASQRDASCWHAGAAVGDVGPQRLHGVEAEVAAVARVVAEQGALHRNQKRPGEGAPCGAHLSVRRWAFPTPLGRAVDASLEAASRCAKVEFVREAGEERRGSGLRVGGGAEPGTGGVDRALRSAGSRFGCCQAFQWGEPFLWARGARASSARCCSGDDCSESRHGGWPGSRLS